MYVVLLGAPGAGKGTQAATLVERFGIAHVASGDLFREHVTKGTELGRLAKSYMDQGLLVPDEVTVRMVLERISQPDCANGVLLDGFPRTVAQAKALKEALAAQGKRIDAVLYIYVPNEVLLDRLSGRLICPVCGEIYHTVFRPPKIPGRCDRDGAQLTQRSDDSRETAERRLAVYFEQTAPLIDYYQGEGLLTTIDGNQSVEAVSAALIAALERVGKVA
jgi:adenylate kinase